MVKKLRAFWDFFIKFSKTSYQLLHGVSKISTLPEPRVTVFGGAKVDQQNTYAHLAHELTHKLIQENISVLTGGGPGIMRATSCTFSEPSQQKMKAKTLGISVQGLDREGEGPGCNYDRIVMEYFFTRKWLLINYSTAFAVFPGGFGTLDEMAEVLTLMQTKKIKGVPVVLINKEYWHPFLVWVNECGVAKGLISEADAQLIHVTDDIDEAVCLLKEQCTFQQ